MVDLEVELFDGSYHEVDSNEMAFKIAGSIGFKEGAKKAGAILLEPIMATEVITPEQFMGNVIGDLSARRGKILHMEPRAGMQVVTAHVPLAEMFGYSTSLRSATEGRAIYTMQFHHYAPVPGHIAETLVRR
jgi:elongation factor G